MSAPSRRRLAWSIPRGASGSAARTRPVTWLLVAGLTSGALGFVADYPHPMPLLLLIAPVPALVAALTLSALRAAAVGALTALVERADVWRALSDPVMGTPRPVVAAMVVGLTATAALLYAVTAALCRRLPAVAAVLVFPALAVLFEYAATLGPGLWFTPSATLAAVPWLRPLAALGGPGALTFVALLVSSTLAVAFARRAPRTVGVPLLLVTGLVVAALAAAPAMPAARVRVAAVVSAISPDVDARWQRREVRSDDTWEVLSDLERVVGRAAAAGARVIVWPEYGVYLRGADRATFRQRVAALAQQSHASVVGGWIDVDAGENGAVLASPNGSVVEYVKQHLVLVVESAWLTPGRRAVGAVDDGTLRVAAQVCYDLDFTAGARAAVQAGAQLLAVPARDWPSIEERHAEQAVLRAAENRVAMVRATRDGRSALVDPSGHVVAEATDAGGPETVLVGDLPVGATGSPYSRTGDLMVVACVVVVLGLLCAGRAWRAVVLCGLLVVTSSNARLVDGTDRAPRDGVSIRIGNGRIAAVIPPGGGTTFEVELPLA